MIKFLKKYKYIVFSIMGILIIIGGIYLKNSLIDNSVVINDIEDNDDILISDKEDNGVSNNEYYLVDIKGAVNNPGVYKVEVGTRINDVVNMAGGLRDDADTSLINLSKLVSDEMVIIIYTTEEVRNSNLVNTVIKVVEKECKCPNIENDGCINDNIKDTITNGSGKVNINTASVEELSKLDGIGQSKAEAIVKYREENGKFNTIEDITKVSGIGNNVYEKIKGNITT